MNALDWVIIVIYLGGMIGLSVYLVPIYSNPIMFAHDLYGSHSGQNNSFF